MQFPIKALLPCLRAAIACTSKLVTFSFDRSANTSFALSSEITVSSRSCAMRSGSRPTSIPVSISASIVSLNTLARWLSRRVRSTLTLRLFSVWMSSIEMRCLVLISSTRAVIHCVVFSLMISRPSFSGIPRLSRSSFSPCNLASSSVPAASAWSILSLNTREDNCMCTSFTSSSGMPKASETRPRFLISYSCRPTVTCVFMGISTTSGDRANSR
mmetsp:Transcript_21893/g.36254  ORF Transcript_21893/g.36254 Transcript_21893/m.36254 type:complete len:215 (+) Transcript_21893:955-1599(+)